MATKLKCPHCGEPITKVIHWQVCWVRFPATIKNGELNYKKPYIDEVYDNDITREDCDSCGEDITDFLMENGIER